MSCQTADYLLVGNKWLMALITAYFWHNIQAPMHEQQCPPCNIILSRGLLVNHFLSFQTIPAIKHAESPTKLRGNIRVRLAAGIASVAVKRRAVNTSIALKTSLYLVFYFFISLSTVFICRSSWIRWIESAGGFRCWNWRLSPMAEFHRSIWVWVLLCIGGVCFLLIVLIFFRVASASV
jgi:hypothetical protein